MEYSNSGRRRLYTGGQVAEVWSQLAAAVMYETHPPATTRDTHRVRVCVGGSTSHTRQARGQNQSLGDWRDAVEESGVT